MLLAINCSNTNIKFGVFDGDRIVGEWRLHTAAMRTADEHAAWLYPAHAHGRHRPQVDHRRHHRQRRAAGELQPAPPLHALPQLRAAVRRRAQRHLRHQDQGRRRGRRPDLQYASVASHDVPADAADHRRLRHAPPTSTSSTRRATICGGAIAPGVNLSIEALSMPRRCCRAFVVEKPEKVIGTTTVACMHPACSGAMSA